MEKSISREIHDLERINATFASFLALPSWTPAMGSLLISGVAPIPGCIDIPESGCSISEPTVAASSRQLTEARGVLNRWHEWRLDREDRAQCTKLFSGMAPHKFLLWCAEDYDEEPDWRKPGWLSYWLAFVGIKQNSGVPDFAPPAIVACAADLDRFSSVINEKIWGSQAKTSNELDQKIAALCRKIEREARISIKAELIIAIKNSTAPLAIGAVFAKLREMAESKKYPVFRYEDGVIKVPAGDDGWRPYNQSTLGQFLRRHDGDIED